LSLVVACQSNNQQQPPPQQASQQQRCGGVQLFVTPACQAALDDVCCAIELDCGKDPNCVQLTSCLQGCKSRNGASAKDNCANGCGVEARSQYCNGACQGQSADCRTLCLQRGGPTEPMMKFGLIANCSKGVRYPQGITCNDST
jgi:hypothetical protein